LVERGDAEGVVTDPDATLDSREGAMPPRAARDRGAGRGGHASASQGSEDLLARGTVVGRYVVVESRGAGAMGVVYAAYDPELDRRVAIKVLRGLKRDSSEHRSRLVREAQALAKLAHPAVVSVHDVGVHDGRVFVAMEFVEGVTLREWLSRARRPW
jgi:serine/threonine protein kinase